MGSPHDFESKNDTNRWLSSAGLGGTEVVKPKCVPGVCFREDMCIETTDGVDCGPCPDGYTGDGFSCDDVDEVSERRALFKFTLPMELFIDETCFSEFKAW